MRHSVSRPLCAVVALLFLLVPALSGCAGRATKADIAALQSAIDELRLQNYEMKQQLAALEAGTGGSVSPAPADTAPSSPALAEEAAATPAPQAAHALAADEICSALLKDGMPVRTFYRYTADSDPDGLLGKPNGYTSRADFEDSESGELRGIVEVFPDNASATLRLTSLATLDKSGDTASEQRYRYDNVLLRLPAAFSAEKCLAYEESLRRVLGLAG